MCTTGRLHLFQSDLHNSSPLPQCITIFPYICHISCPVDWNWLLATKNIKLSCVFQSFFLITSYYIYLYILVWYWLSIGLYTIVFEILETVYEVETHSYKTCTSGFKLPLTAATMRRIIIIYIKSSEFMGLAQLTENVFTLMKHA